MKLKTRLFVTFIAMVILPLLLITVAFMSIGHYLLRAMQQEYGIETITFQSLTNAIQSSDQQTAYLFEKLQDIADEDPSLFTDIPFLESLNRDAQTNSSYLIVRKDAALYYTGNQLAAEKIFFKLPAYGYETQENDAGYYYNQLQKLVRQIDFLFPDGTNGSIFIITPVNNLISKSLLIDMCIAIILILIFTALILSQWIHRSIFCPIRDLGMAMQQIAEGNLDYSLPVTEKGEFGSLYKNYEDMRLRLKESIDEKFQNEKQNRELITNISHDLKTPITAIKGYVEGIMDGVANTPEKMDKYIKTVYNKANDMDRLINQLAFYSGIDSNRIPYNFHRINVNEYFRDCIEEVGLDLESKDIELNYSNLVDPSTRIIADPEQLKRVIDNIIGNSVKYMDKPKGVIDIRILDEVDSICVEIEDNGKGVAPKDLSSIFERFYRTDTSRNSSKGGSGIGLSIVKKIIEDHGGYIWATSKENEGTCLHFVIRKYREVENYEQDIDH